MGIFKMSQDKLMVELGCGSTKQEGFIGVDRFNLEGVDIVADMNQKFPFDDNSVDVIYSSHAIEHLDSIEHVMSEIWRICKNNAICIIIVPYFNNYGNIANHYHKLYFNEHTFRYFTKTKEFLTQQEELEIPSLYGTWGLSMSDNSDNEIDIRTIDMDYIYYEEYNGVPDDIKYVLRQNLNNICNMIVYTLVIKKDGKQIGEAEKNEFMKTRNEIVAKLPLNNLKTAWANFESTRKTVYSLWVDENRRKEKEIATLSVKLEELNNEFEERLNIYVRELDALSTENDRLNSKIVEFDKKIQELSNISIWRLIANRFRKLLKEN